MARSGFFATVGACLLALGGCGTVILDADFERNTAGANLPRNLPGPPPFDQAVALDAKSNPRILVSGDDPITGRRSYRFAVGTVLEPLVPRPATIFVPAANPNGKFVGIAWKGRSNGVPIRYHLTDRKGKTYLAGFLGNGRFSANFEQVPGVPDGSVHSVAISLDADTDTFSMTVFAPGWPPRGIGGRLARDFVSSEDLTLTFTIDADNPQQEYTIDDVRIELFSE